MAASESKSDAGGRARPSLLIDVLDQVEWIGKALSEHELGEHDLPYYLEELSKLFSRRKYDKGVKVVEAGEKMKRMIIVLSGVAMEEGGTADGEPRPAAERITHGHTIGTRGLLERSGKRMGSAQHEHEIVAKSSLYTAEICVRHFADWCTRESEVGDIMLEALDEAEKKKEAEVLAVLKRNRHLYEMLLHQECVVSLGKEKAGVEGSVKPRRENGAEERRRWVPTLTAFSPNRTISSKSALRCLLQKRILFIHQIHHRKNTKEDQEKEKEYQRECT